MPSSICDLAPELLYVIFTFAVHDYFSSSELVLPGQSALVTSKEVVEEYKRLNAIRRVCQHWNDIAISQPSLWTDLNASSWKHVIELSIARSKDLPLNVAWKGSRRWSSRPTVLGQGTRIASLSLDSVPPDVMAWVTNCPLPRLRTLRMVHTLPEKLLRAHGHQIEHLFLERWAYADPNFPLLRALRTLSLQIVKINGVDLLNVVRSCADHLHHLRMSSVALGYTPNTLWIPEADGYSQEKPRLLDLPFLESLEIVSMSVEDVLGLLQNTKLPRDMAHLRVGLGDFRNVVVRNALQETVQQELGSDVQGGTPRVIFTVRGMRKSWISI